MIVQRHTALASDYAAKLATTAKIAAAPRQTSEAASANTADTVTLSDAAKGKTYRVDGPVYSLAEKLKPAAEGVRKFSPERIEEHKLWEAQMAAREELIGEYARTHSEPVHGQVVVNGKLFATAFEHGGVEMPYAIPGLSDDGAGAMLADARLHEIAKRVGGEIRYTNLLTRPNDGTCSTIPESFLATLPPITARPLWQIDETELLQPTAS